ncbi:hypothetical protein QQX98_001433 [Neonectria punicea]|uniref:C2H2-type domain-containing protein n=1 Tax=Neonectria punicea TaxID=979145 RepID=A0ABR1HP52_9HYPO
MDIDQLPSAQAGNQPFASPSHSQSWQRQAAPLSFEPMQPEPRFHNAHDRPFDHRASTVNRSGHSLGYDRDLEPMEGYQYYSAPQQGHGGSSAADAAPPSPVGTSSASSSPRDDCYGWMNTVDSSERQVCHCGKAFRRPSDLAKHQKYHIKYFSCLFSGCEKAFATQKDLSRHVRTHRKGDGWRCTVDGCRKAAAGHVYSRKDNFDRHMRTAHGDS